MKEIEKIIKELKNTLIKIPSINLKQITIIIIEELYNRDEQEIVEELTDFCLDVERGNYDIDKSKTKEKTDINKWKNNVSKHIKSDFILGE